MLQLAAFLRHLSYQIRRHIYFVSLYLFRLMFKKAPMVQKKGQNMFNQDAEKEYRRLSQFVTTLNHPIDLTESEYKK